MIINFPCIYYNNSIYLLIEFNDTNTKKFFANKSKTKADCCYYMLQKNLLKMKPCTTYFKLIKTDKELIAS